MSVFDFLADRCCTLTGYNSLMATILLFSFSFLFFEINLNKKRERARKLRKVFIQGGYTFIISFNLAPLKTSTLLCGFTVIQSIQRVSFTQIINSTKLTCNITLHLWIPKPAWVIVCMMSPCLNSPYSCYISMVVFQQEEYAFENAKTGDRRTTFVGHNQKAQVREHIIPLCFLKNTFRGLCSPDLDYLCRK